MGRDLDPNLRRAIAERLGFYRDLGIHDFYRRGDAALEGYLATQPAAASGVELVHTGEPQNGAGELRRIREDLGDCTRCPLHRQGRKQIVFGTGNPDADLMFVGEGPGADEDEQGIPFVGRAGQLLTSMITNGMGLRREDVYIANVVKCRPPGNRTPERE